jgi:outer membrane biosynthesis protein TonB
MRALQVARQFHMLIDDLLAMNRAWYLPKLNSKDWLYKDTQLWIKPDHIANVKPKAKPMQAAKPTGRSKPQHVQKQKPEETVAKTAKKKMKESAKKEAEKEAKRDVKGKKSQLTGKKRSSQSEVVGGSGGSAGRIPKKGKIMYACTKEGCNFRNHYPRCSAMNFLKHDALLLMFDVQCA